MQKYLSLLLLSLLMAFGVAGQTRVITGTVTDVHNNSIYNAVVKVKGTKISTRTNLQGAFSLKVPVGDVIIEVIAVNFQQAEQTVGAKQSKVQFKLQVLAPVLAPNEKNRVISRRPTLILERKTYAAADLAVSEPAMMISPAPKMNTEDYSPINENTFHKATDQPLSTFSADVDRASYSNVRRFLNNGELPPADAVRVEEMINYFDYNYASPKGKDPVAIYTDIAVCPWNTAHHVVRIALKGKQVDARELPASNLVFLIDVSGSMADENKLPLVQKAFKALTDQLRPQDKVAIVVYAGAAGMVLPSTNGSEKGKILDALDKLEAGGSTAGGEGIKLAYKIAEENFVKRGNNRVILATDGDFNVGPSSDGALQRIIETERQKGVFLSVLGFGMGNYKDNKLELLADKGNGNYAYIDNFEEARRTFVTEFGGTLFTIAKDVKLQVEFNPTFVQSYRLVGYENRTLQNEDFNNDKKDAGDMGVGHTVTALYEIIPTNSNLTGVNWVDPLKYQQSKIIGNSTEVLTVKLRYKEPDADKSKLLQQALPYRRQQIEQVSEDFRMACAAAAFGQLLRNSAFKGDVTYDQVLNWAGSARGVDKEGYRAEFVQLVKKARLLDKE
ncbi:MAG TPA: von Willebrand factor type A domain-containing protein [Chitinophaga sp.]|uniref:vWA domain-containing protein n=1 Tax=Chitinophaga sp. TaxID=1869181 RepID=UPI002B8D6B6E|nr:von Willebrand factor type A domain-containing protein [Chitinophaga sp.]HVI45512.1 von Willebrand factor type A domain-containing protein [Chitinophaga sp.]